MEKFIPGKGYVKGFNEDTVPSIGYVNLYDTTPVAVDDTYDITTNITYSGNVTTNDTYSCT